MRHQIFITLPLLACLLAACSPDNPKTTPGYQVSPQTQLTSIYIDDKPLEITIPGNLMVHIYQMNRAPVPEEWGYSEIEKLLSITDPSDEKGVLESQIIDANRLLDPFHYHFKFDPSAGNAALFQNDNQVADDIRLVFPITIKRDGTDFCLVIERGDSSKLLVQKDEIQTQPQNSEDPYWRGYPRYLGDSLIAAIIERDGNTRTVKVTDNGREIYRIDFSQAAPLDGIYGLWTDDSHWYLEVADHVVVDGVSQNELKGYSASFEFHLVDRDPFFLFIKDGQAGVYFNGVETSLPGDFIPHYACCSGAELNPQQGKDRTAFFLRDGKKWMYVNVSSDASK